MMLNLFRQKQAMKSASNASVFGCPPRFLELSLIRFFCGVEPDEEQSLTLSYLINSCGLSPTAAKSATKKVRISSPENSDMVLKLLKEQGLSNAQITKMVTKQPDILVARPQETILPKLEYFNSVGMPPPILASMISRCPSVLRYSLEKRIIPFYTYLKGFLREDERAAIAFKRGAEQYLHALQQVRANVEMLIKYGVSESNVSFLLVHHPGVLMVSSDRLANWIDRVLGYGINISKLIFIEAIRVFQDMSDSTWERKKQVYHKWGWSESDMRCAFSIHPICMSLSEQKIMSTMEFLVNEMDCEPRAIAKYPTVLNYNLEKRIAPRCRVVKLLMVKEVIKKYKLVTIVAFTDKKFSEKFIAKYHHVVPCLLDVYDGKLSLLDLGFDSNQLARVQLV